MSTNAGIQPPTSSPDTDKPDVCKRVEGVALFALVELDPREVVAGVRVEGGLAAPDVVPVGQMREVCPHCRDAALQLILRANNVIRTHLFCAQCTRCFDAVYPDGCSALLLPQASVVD